MYFILPGVPRRGKKKIPSTVIKLSRRKKQLDDLWSHDLGRKGQCSKHATTLQASAVGAPAEAQPGSSHGCSHLQVRRSGPSDVSQGSEFLYFLGQKGQKVKERQILYKHSGGCGCQSTGLRSAASHLRHPCLFLLLIVGKLASGEAVFYQKCSGLDILSSRNPEGAVGHNWPYCTAGAAFLLLQVMPHSRPRLVGTAQKYPSERILSVESIAFYRQRWKKEAQQSRYKCKYVP